MCVENECMKEINTKNVTEKVHSKCVSGASEILREQSGWLNLTPYACFLLT